MLTDEKVVDITLDIPEKTAFRVNGQNDKLLKLNISDLGIINRVENGYAKLQEEVSKIAELSTDDENLTEKMNEIDKVMRDQIDYIFDSNVSEICAADGTMYDPKNGVLRFEHILDTLLKLYEKNIQDEYKKIKNRVEKHTAKYTGGKGKSNKKS